MEEKKKKKELNPGIYGQLSSAGLETLNRMMNETFPQPKKKAVKKEKK